MPTLDEGAPEENPSTDVDPETLVFHGSMEP